MSTTYKIKKEDKNSVIKDKDSYFCLQYMQASGSESDEVPTEPWP